MRSAHGSKATLHLERERLALALAAGAAVRRIFFSYPRIDLDQARPPEERHRDHRGHRAGLLYLPMTLMPAPCRGVLHPPMPPMPRPMPRSRADQAIGRCTPFSSGLLSGQDEATGTRARELPQPRLDMLAAPSWVD
jgi:hypothetical protein